MLLLQQRNANLTQWLLVIAFNSKQKDNQQSKSKQSKQQKEKEKDKSLSWWEDAVTMIRSIALGADFVSHQQEAEAKKQQQKQAAAAEHSKNNRHKEDASLLAKRKGGSIRFAMGLYHHHHRVAVSVPQTRTSGIVTEVTNEHQGDAAASSSPRISHSTRPSPARTTTPGVATEQTVVPGRRSSRLGQYDSNGGSRGTRRLLETSPPQRDNTGSPRHHATSSSPSYYNQNQEAALGSSMNTLLSTMTSQQNDNNHATETNNVPSSRGRGFGCGVSPTNTNDFKSDRALSGEGTDWIYLEVERCHNIQRVSSSKAISNDDSNKNNVNNTHRNKNSSKHQWKWKWRAKKRPTVVIKYNHREVGRTPVLQPTNNPTWQDQCFNFPVRTDADGNPYGDLILELWDSNGDDILVDLVAKSTYPLNKLDAAKRGREEIHEYEESLRLPDESDRVHLMASVRRSSLRVRASSITGAIQHHPGIKYIKRQVTSRPKIASEMQDDDSDVSMHSGEQFKVLVNPFPFRRREIQDGSEDDTMDSAGFWSSATVKALSMLVLYLLMGIIGFSFSFEKWSIRDSLYFSIVTFTTGKCSASG
jgi:hypothetical protein